jgi:hypothetical protein
MKKHLLPGVILGFSLFLNVTVWANSVRDTQAPVRFQNAEESTIQPTIETTAPNKSTAPYRDRVANDTVPDWGARWSQMGRDNQANLYAFTSTFAANNAALMMSQNGNSLSFASFGRVPYHQMISVTNQISGNTNKSSSPVASLPEPATLTLLGAGLAALAAGLRKRKKNVNK